MRKLSLLLIAMMILLSSVFGCATADFGHRGAIYAGKIERCIVLGRLPLSPELMEVQKLIWARRD